MSVLKHPGSYKAVLITSLIVMLGLAALLGYQFFYKHTPGRTEREQSEFIAAFNSEVDTESDLGGAAVDKVFMNKSAAVIKIEINDDLMPPEERELYPTFAAARHAASRHYLPSIEAIDAYAKQTDDALLTALEAYIHNGSSIYRGGKQGFLQELLVELLKAPSQAGQDTAAAFIAAAIQLGGDAPVAPAPVLKQAQDITAEFLNHPEQSRPIGAYSASKTLERIFQRDRFLQRVFQYSPLADSSRTSGPLQYGYMPAVRMAEALLRRPDLLKAYHSFLVLGQQLSNPCADLHLEDLIDHQQYFGNEALLADALLDSPAGKLAQQAGAGQSLDFGVAVWPFTSSMENRLWDKVSMWGDGNGDDADGSNGSGSTEDSSEPATKAVDIVIQALQSGDVQVEPVPDSGWYDYQLYAMETLAVPEHGQEYSKFIYSDSYRQRLMDAFASLMALNRESHVKDLATGIDKCFTPIVVQPELHLEPALTHYLRIARGYRFLKHSLSRIFTEDDLQTITLAGSRQDLSTRLDSAATLFYGLYLLGCDDIGLKPVLETDEPLVGRAPAAAASQESQFSITRLPDLTAHTAARYQAACATAKQWLEELDSDPACNSDTRIIVPVRIFDNMYARYMVILGVKNKFITASYATLPSITDANGNAIKEQLVVIRPHDYMISTLAYREVDLGLTPPTREELRAICDQGGTEDEILQRLKDQFKPQV